MTRWIACLLLVAGSARAQSNVPVDPLALLKALIGTNVAFSAAAVLTGTSANDDESFVMDVNYAMLQRRVRTETDLTKLRGAHACDNAQDRLREAGLDLVVSVIDVELKRHYTIYPRAQVYVDGPMDWRERRKEISDVQRTELGPETVAGHPCIKMRVVATDQMGDESEVLVWEATDLKRFPIQMRFDIPDASFVLAFHDVNLSEPDVAQFQPPADFYRYTDLAQLTRAVRGH